ncbi:MAG: TM1812 family CRISPR-associated protein [Planctomycetota bacterium]
MEAGAGQHILIAALGLGARETCYSWRGRTATASSATLALLEMLEAKDRPGTARIFATQKAREETWPQLEPELGRWLSAPPELIEVPEPGDDGDLREIISGIAGAVPAGAGISIDLTHGYRHMPLLLYATALYLSSLRDVQIRHAVYGALHPNDRASVLLDLLPLLKLPHWFHAVRLFREHGDAAPVADLLLETISSRSPLRKVGKCLQNLATAYSFALPLELAKAAEGAGKVLDEEACRQFDTEIPLGRELATALRLSAERWSFQDPAGRRSDWKPSVILNEQELGRQARLINSYLDLGRYPEGFGLMREWLVNWALLRSGQADGWLVRERRVAVERRIGALAKAAEKDSPLRGHLSREQIDFQSFWQHISSHIRNALHHHGMRQELVKISPSTVESLRREWTERWSRAPELDLDLPAGGGTWLVTPLGRQPGVLFSALRIARPDRCIVIASDETLPQIDEAVRRANFTGAVDRLAFQDPHLGFGSEQMTIARQIGSQIALADDVVVNVTGGTTLMCLTAEKVAAAAETNGRKVRRLVLVDRRSEQEKVDDPWVESKCKWLDQGEDGEHPND